MKTPLAKSTFAATVLASWMMAGPLLAEQDNYTDLTGQEVTEDELVSALQIPVRGIGAGCAVFQEEMTRMTRGIGTLPTTAAEVPALQTMKSAGLSATFDLDSAQLTPLAKEQFKTVAEALNSNSLANQCFQIAGHTCDLGDAEHNMELSRERADAVKNYLVAQGVDPERLITTGYGETSPIVPNTSEEQRRKNRRVEVGALAPMSVE